MSDALLPIMTYIYDDAGWITGIVVKLPSGVWEHRELRVEDRMLPPVRTGELVTTLRPYLAAPGSPS
jgi:hypothetical protein